MGEDRWEIYQTDGVAAWMRDLRRTDPQAADALYLKERAKAEEEGRE